MRAEAGPAAGPDPRPSPTPVRSALTAVAVLALAGGLSLIGTRASAVLLDVPENGTPGYLSLSSDWSTAMLDVSPGDPGHWLIAAELGDADVAALAVEIRSGGELAEVDAGVLVRLDRCDAAWIPAPAADAHAAPVCAGGSAPVLAATPLSAFRGEGPRTALPDITAAAGEHLLLTASVDPARAGDSRVMGRTGSLAVGLTAMGADPAPVVPAPPAVGGVLPRTGSALDVVAVALAAAGALALGLLMRRPGSRRRPDPAPDGLAGDGA